MKSVMKYMVLTQDSPFPCIVSEKESAKGARC